jgi:hypothetical protein
MFRPIQAIISAILHRNTGKLQHDIYIQLKCLLCVAVRNVKTIKCIGVKRLKYSDMKSLSPECVCTVLWLWIDSLNS